MSGGHFDYLQYRIMEISDSIEEVIVKNNVEIENVKHESWDYDKNGELYPWSKYYYCFDNDIIEKFKEGYWKLREAQVFAQRIDWLLSGDDDEDSFRKRLKEDIEELEKEKESKKWNYIKDENDEG